MKLAHLCFHILSAATLAGVEVKLRFLDDERRPLAGVAATVIFVKSNPRDDLVREGLSDPAGLFVARESADGWISIRAKREGRYGIEYQRLEKTQDHDLTVIMRRIIRPIPLYADTCRLFSYDNHNPPPMPYLEETYAYDFEVGDLLPPHGKGRIADVQVHTRAWLLGSRLSEEKLREEEAWARRAGMAEGAMRASYGRWRSEQVITFPGKDAGFVQLSPGDFQPYSELKHPHEAPLEGYQSEMRGGNSTEALTWSDPYRPTTGYFLRTRVKHDAQGRIVSANYGKIVGEIRFSPAGAVDFRYHFNPTPNDRNLEFDLEKNLLKGKKPLLSAPYR